MTLAASGVGLAAQTIETRVVEAKGGARFSYIEAGEPSAPALVLLHGIGSGARSFQDQVAALSDRFHVVAWDAPGYGGSSRLSKPHPDAGDYAEAVGGFLDALGIGQCHLLGHSLGCLMAARFAAQRPERVLSLTLSSIAAGHGSLPVEEREKLLQQRLSDVANLGPRAMAEKRGPRLLGPEATPAMIARVIDAMGAVHPEGYVQAARMLSTGDVKADIQRLPAGLKLQIVYGDADVITPPARNQDIAALRPQAPVTVIPSAGHALYLEKPDVFNAALANFALQAA